MSESREEIYHIVPEAEFRARADDALYVPATLERDGFVHCATEPSVLPVASDYFSDVAGRLLVLEIDPARLAAETRYEAPAPIAGGGTAHLEMAVEFPHVYGPIDRAAIVGVGVLAPGGKGYRWPAELRSLEAYLSDPTDLG